MRVPDPDILVIQRPPLFREGRDLVHHVPACSEGARACWGRGGAGLLLVPPHFCWGGGGVGAAKSLLPSFLVPKGNQPTACTLALWWLKFGPTDGLCHKGVMQCNHVLHGDVLCPQQFGSNILRIIVRELLLFGCQILLPFEPNNVACFLNDTHSAHSFRRRGVEQLKQGALLLGVQKVGVGGGGGAALVMQSNFRLHPSLGL